jgi:hypothetical protein
MGGSRASKNIIRALTALTIAEFTAGIVASSYRDHRSKHKIFELCENIHGAVERARSLWGEGGIVLFNEMKVYTKWLETNVLCGSQHTCQRIYFAWYLLQDVLDGLWEARSKKVGAIDDIIRYIEDLFIYFQIDEENHQEEAVKLYLRWMESLNEKPKFKQRLRVNESGRIRVSV